MARTGALPAGLNSVVAGHAAGALAALLAAGPPAGARRPLAQKIVTTLRPLLQRLRRAVCLPAAPRCKAAQGSLYGADEIALPPKLSGLAGLPPQLRLALALRIAGQREALLDAWGDQPQLVRDLCQLEVALAAAAGHTREQGRVAPAMLAAARKLTSALGDPCASRRVDMALLRSQYQAQLCGPLPQPGVLSGPVAARTLGTAPVLRQVLAQAAHPAALRLAMYAVAGSRMPAVAPQVLTPEQRLHLQEKYAAQSLGPAAAQASATEFWADVKRLLDIRLPGPGLPLVDFAGWADASEAQQNAALEQGRQRLLDTCAGNTELAGVLTQLLHQGLFAPLLALIGRGRIGALEGAVTQADGLLVKRIELQRAREGGIDITVHLHRHGGKLVSDDGEECPLDLHSWQRATASVHLSLPTPDDPMYRVALLDDPVLKRSCGLPITQQEPSMSHAEGELLHMLAYVYVQNGAPARAATLYAALHQLSPGDGAVAQALAWARIESGQLQAALEVLDGPAAAQAPALLNALLRARAHAGLRQDEAAHAAMQAFMRLRAQAPGVLQ